jgi:hypothetical protein
MLALRLLNRSTELYMRPWRATGSDTLAITLRLGACAVVFALLLLATGCGPAAGTPEEQLRQWVGAVEAAAENKARGEILDLIAPSYNDARGHSREDIEKRLMLYFLREQRIALVTSIDDIRIEGGTAASLTVMVGMAGTSDSAALGLSADAYRFELELEATESPASYRDWQLLSARWGELGAPAR